jgi:hypothetical protein
MAIYPHAKWEPISGHTNGPMNSYLGVVLHCNDAQSYDLHDYFNNPANEVSSHFQVAKDGTVWQYIDTKNTSWCQSDGNNDYLSIESQGLASERATAAQVAAIGGILAWCETTHGIPLQLAEIPGQRGFGWHGMGALHGFNWGHALCPGVRKDQRTAMLAAATSQGEDMPLDANDPVVKALTAAIADVRSTQTKYQQDIDARLETLRTTLTGARDEVKKTVSDTSAGVLASVSQVSGKVTDVAAAVGQIQAGSGGGPLTVTLTGTAAPAVP